MPLQTSIGAGRKYSKIWSKTCKFRATPPIFEEQTEPISCILCSVAKTRFQRTLKVLTVSSGFQISCICKDFNFSLTAMKVGSNTAVATFRYLPAMASFVSFVRPATWDKSRAWTLWDGLLSTQISACFSSPPLCHYLPQNDSVGTSVSSALYSTW